MVDSFDLDRFVGAQEGTYARALAEIRAGDKVSHWMWFIFPQFDGLGYSSMARKYSIKSIEEAKAYLAHPVLGARLIECAEAAMGVKGKTANELFGSPDDMKLRSSMTLFAREAEDDAVFIEVLRKYFGGVEDERTVELMGDASSG